VYPLRKSPEDKCLEQKFWFSLRLESPLFLCGKVIKGYNRGSSSLGIPTANLDTKVPQLEKKFPFAGVYYGWAQVDCEPNMKFEKGFGQVQKMVLSVGYSPYFDNPSITLEPYIMAEFQPYNFLGCSMKLVVVGAIRAEADFPKFEHLVQAIQNDCEVADIMLDASPCCATWKGFFNGNENCENNISID